jgi:hypothetical protein
MWELRPVIQARPSTEGTTAGKSPTVVHECSMPVKVAAGA